MNDEWVMDWSIGEGPFCAAVWLEGLLKTSKPVSVACLPAEI